MKMEQRLRPLDLRALLIAALVTLGSSSRPASAQVVLTNGALTVDIRADNGAIDSATFGGRDFFNPGTPVSDWGLQIDVDTNSFRFNDTSGLIGIPVSVVGAGSSAQVIGVYAVSGANLGFIRRYELVSGLNAVSVTTEFTNYASTPITFSYFDTFDPDQDSPPSSGTFNDVYSASLTRLASGAKSSNSAASGTPTLTFIAATKDPNATVAAGARVMRPSARRVDRRSRSRRAPAARSETSGRAT